MRRFFYFSANYFVYLFPNNIVTNIFAMKTNPFKFGTIVDGSYFTDREEEMATISSYLKSHNHLILISPRRYGKTSLIRKVIAGSERAFIYLDLQMVISVDDLASQILKRIYRIFTFQKIKGFIKAFRLIPTVTMHPVTGEAEISFKPGSKELSPLEDVLNLIEKLASPNKSIIVVLDEFQEIFRINEGLDKLMRSVMQNHKNINYVFTGSSESMIREIFEKKSSPFYRFGTLMTLGKITPEKFTPFLEEKFDAIIKNGRELSESIIKISGSHPFYTQQLAFTVWELITRNGFSKDIAETAADEIVRSHDNDFERLWNSLNRTDMTLLTGIATSDVSPLSDAFSRIFGTGAASTTFSTLQRLLRKGLVIKENGTYDIDDPFMKRWILVRREA
jgi:uncharacterized protein